MAKAVLDIINTEKDGDTFRRAYIIKSRNDEDTSAYMFATPDFTEEYKEHISEKGINIQYYVGASVDAVVSTAYELYLENRSEPPTCPLSD